MPARSMVALSAALLSACSGADKVIGLAQHIHHDDFEYSVQRVDRAERIGNRQATGLFHVVTFEVENRARVVDHVWDNAVAYLVDDNEAQYENDAAAQQALTRVEPFNLKDRYITRAGALETTRLVFDLPRAVRRPYLKVRGMVLMGDVFDGMQYRRTRVRLF